MAAELPLGWWFGDGVSCSLLISQNPSISTVPQWALGYRKIYSDDWSL